MTDLGRKIVAAARSYLGTPFAHQGDQPGVGLDCIGLVACAARAAGRIPRYRKDYPADVPPNRILRGLQANGCYQLGPRERWGDGDVLTFWVRRRGNPTHAAIADGAGLIHVVAGSFVLRERAVPPWWAARLHSAWRVR